MAKIDEYTVIFVDLAIPINAPGHPRETQKPNEILVSLNAAGEYVYALFECPCGCRRWVSCTLQGSDFKPEGATWTLTLDDKQRPTIRASVYMFGWQCKSHFFITAGKVQWC